MSPSPPNQPPQQAPSGGLDWQKLIQWLMARGAMAKAGGTVPQQPSPPPPTGDPLAALKAAIAQNPNNSPMPQPTPEALRVLATPSKKKRAVKKTPMLPDTME